MTEENQVSKKKTIMVLVVVFLFVGLLLVAINYFVEPEPIPEGSFLNPLPDESKKQEIIDEIDRTIPYTEGSP